MNSNNEILISVMIPTRDRPTRLLHCLQTCADSKFKNVEFVVINNNSSEETNKVIEKFNYDERIKHIFFDVSENINGQFKRCLDFAKGQWISIIGDDDGILPSVFDEFSELIYKIQPKISEYKAIKWPHAIYRWADFPGDEANLIKIDKYSNRTNFSVYKNSNLFFNFEDNNLKKIYHGPQIYHGLVSRSYANSINSRFPEHTFFMSPDISFAFQVAADNVQFLEFSKPVTMFGYSGSSTGQSVAAADNKEVRKKYYDENPFVIKEMSQVLGINLSETLDEPVVSEVMANYTIACIVADTRNLLRPSIVAYLTSEINNAKKLAVSLRLGMKALLNKLLILNHIRADLSVFDSKINSKSLGGIYLSINELKNEKVLSLCIKPNQANVQNVYEAVHYVQSLSSIIH